MSSPHFNIIINNKRYIGRMEGHELTNGYIPLWIAVDGVRINVEVKPEDVISMNTEAGHWLESQGVGIPEHTKVHGTGYGADIKLSHWKETHKTDGR